MPFFNRHILSWHMPSLNVSVLLTKIAFSSRSAVPQPSDVLPLEGESAYRCKRDYRFEVFSQAIAKTPDHNLRIISHSRRFFPESRVSTGCGGGVLERRGISFFDL